MISKSGPNVGQDEESFFQTDKNLQLNANRKAKKTELGKLGSPIKMASKVLNFSFEENSVFVAESGFIIEEVELPSQTVKTKFIGHQGPVTAAISNKTAGILVSSSWDKTIKKWDLSNGKLLLTLNGHADFVKNIYLHGNTVYSCSSDRQICAWDLTTGKLKKSYVGHARAVEDVVVSPDGQELYSCSSDGTIKKWNVETGEIIQTLEGHDTSVYRLLPVWEQDCMWSVSADKTAIRWDLIVIIINKTGLKDARLKHPDFVKSIAIAPSGHVITGCRDENIRVWDPANEKCIANITAHFGEVSCLFSSAHSAIFWSGSLDCTIRSWNLTHVLENFGQENEENEPEPEFPTMTEEEERELAELMGL